MLSWETKDALLIFAIAVKSKPKSGCIVHMLNDDVLHLIHLQVQNLDTQWQKQAEELCSLTTIRLLVSLRTGRHDVDNI